MTNTGHVVSADTIQWINYTLHFEQTHLKRTKRTVTIISNYITILQADFKRTLYSIHHIYSSCSRNNLTILNEDITYSIKIISVYIKNSTMTKSLPSTLIETSLLKRHPNDVNDSIVRR